MGCFGMTEFGGGSSIQQFETTATFDKNTDQFILHRYLHYISQQQLLTTTHNSPTITATKWWMGMAAHVRPSRLSLFLLYGSPPHINTLIDGDTLYSICKADQ